MFHTMHTNIENNNRAAAATSILVSNVFFHTNEPEINIERLW